MIEARTSILAALTSIRCIDFAKLINHWATDFKSVCCLGKVTRTLADFYWTLESIFLKSYFQASVKHKSTRGNIAPPDFCTAASWEPFPLVLLEPRVLVETAKRSIWCVWGQSITTKVTHRRWEIELGFLIPCSLASLSHSSLDIFCQKKEHSRYRSEQSCIFKRVGHTLHRYILRFLWLHVTALVLMRLVVYT